VVVAQVAVMVVVQGGAGTGGGYVSAQFNVNPGDVVEIAVGAAGNSGRNSTIVNEYRNSYFQHTYCCTLLEELLHYLALVPQLLLNGQNF
jgi:hypothetical protein